jgi:hypothetical protein
VKRSRLSVGAKSLERGSTFKPARPSARTGTPPYVWAAVLFRDGARCVWCDHDRRTVPAEHPHHLLPKQTWPGFVDAVPNVVALCARHHMQHEFSPSDRLPWEAIPASCREFLAAVALVDARAARLIAVKYPKTNREG